LGGAGPGAGGAAAAPQQPIVVSRNGKDFKLTGTQATVRSGIELKVKTERPQLNLSLAEMNKDSWIIFELPGFASAASGTKQDSMDALRKASVTSYFKDKDALWVKLVVPRDPALPILPTVSQVSIAVSRNAPDAAPQVASR
jgi:cell migration-inducing and hyaluronan-binding protein